MKKIDSTLMTGIKNVKNVQQYTIGDNAINDLPSLIEKQRVDKQQVVFFIDEFFDGDEKLKSSLGFQSQDELIFVSTKEEPTTKYINNKITELHEKGVAEPACIVGMGGGITMDIAKAVSNLLTNGGKAEDYQGWDLVKIPGI